MWQVCELPKSGRAHDSVAVGLQRQTDSRQALITGWTALIQSALGAEWWECLIAS